MGLINTEGVDWLFSGRGPPTVLCPGEGAFFGISGAAADLLQWAGSGLKLLHMSGLTNLTLNSVQLMIPMLLLGAGILNFHLLSWPLGHYL